MNSGELRITTSDTADQDGRIQATLESGGAGQQIFFQSQDIRLRLNHEALIAAGLLPGMLTGSNLVVDGPLSRQFLGALNVIMDMFCYWRPDLRRVEIRSAAPIARARPGPGRVGIFFSGGVDTFYTLLKHRQAITDLIFINGFDIPAGEQGVYQRASALIHRVADRLGLRVVEVETNLRPYLVGQGLRWGQFAHGPLLASVGHLLYPEFERLFIATSMYYGRIVPWSSHPLLDPLWSTEGLEFAHDGLEANRLEKVQQLAQEDWVLGMLRVCGKRPAAAPNCGRCEKCIRTMLSLLAAGALERCPTFEVGLEARRIARLVMKRPGTFNYAEQNLRALEAAGRSPEFIGALRKAINRSRRRMQLRARVQAVSPAGYRVLSRAYHALRHLTRGARDPEMASE